MDYDIRDGKESFGFQQAMRLELGTAIHTMWNKIMTSALGDDFVGAEKEIKEFIEIPGPNGELTGHGFELTGHPDGEIESLDATWELKSCSSSTFDMVMNQGHAIPAHYEQDNLYAFLLKRSNLLFQYFNKDTSESLYLSAPMSPDLAESTLEKFRQRYRNRLAGVIEGRPYSDPTQSPCWYCSKKAICYEGFESEVRAMTPATLYPEHDQEIYNKLQSTWALRANRLICEKQEDINKYELAHKLMQMGHNKITIGNFLVDVKLGKNNNPLVNIKSLEKKE